jgi:Methyltransferase domain
MTLAALKNCVPRPLKQAARTAWQRQQLRRAMQRLLAAPPGVAPERPLLAALRDAWDNDGFTADVDFLMEVARWAAVTPGPVLECGSGLTTLLLGAIAGRRGVEVWSLEHDQEWRRRVAAALRDHVAGQVYLWLSPLGDYGEFVWYMAPLPLMPPEFRLVVCDGPPDGTRGGRFGLLSVIGDRLPPGAVILLDDAARDSEQDTLGRWTHSLPLAVAVRQLPGGTLAEITRC